MKIEFISNYVFSDFFKKWKQGYWLSSVSILLILLFISSLIYVRYGFVYFVVAFSFGALYATLINFVPFFREINIINRMPLSVIITDDCIELITEEVQLFYGLIKKPAKIIKLNRSAFKTRLLPNPYPINHKYLTTVYSFYHEQKEYYLIKDFFDDFESLKQEVGIK